MWPFKKKQSEQDMLGGAMHTLVVLLQKEWLTDLTARIADRDHGYAPGTKVLVFEYKRDRTEVRSYCPYIPHPQQETKND